MPESTFKPTKPGDPDYEEALRRVEEEQYLQRGEEGGDDLTKDIMGEPMSLEELAGGEGPKGKLRPVRRR